MFVAGAYRKFVLAVAGAEPVARAAQQVGLRLGATRFVAGETLSDALAVVRDLNRRSLLVTLDHLGEEVASREAERDAAEEIHRMLGGIQSSGVQANVSLKLSQLGLAFDRDLAMELLTGIVRRAHEQNCFIRIDMESSAYTEQTLGIYYILRRQGYDNVGPVIQSYLYRSFTDLEELDRWEANVRIVKGAYAEPPTVAYRRKADVDDAFRRMVEQRLRKGLYTAVATHDERLIAFTQELAEREGIPRDRFEFQMLYGVRMARQESLAREGYRVRCYVPYGRQWYPYFVRRIAETPSNLGFLLRVLLRR